MDVLVLALHDYTGVLCSDYFPKDRVQEEFSLAQQNEFLVRLESVIIDNTVDHLCVYVGSECSNWKGSPVSNMSTATFIGMFHGSPVPKITVLIDAIIEVDEARLPFVRDPLSNSVFHEDIPEWPNMVTFHIYREPLPTENMLLNDSDNDDETFDGPDDDPPSVRRTITNYHIHEILFTRYR